MHPVKLWKALDKARVQCGLCSHACRIDPGDYGQCGVRRNVDGELFTLAYDRVAAVNLDPVEKKPLYHFMPGTSTFSLGTMGCNLACSFCQNYTLSQPPRNGHPVQGQKTTPQALVDAALRSGAASMAYTYSEPTVFFELMLDTAKLAVRHGLKNILVSNGFMSPACLDELGPYIHAANIDLKAFTEAFYQERCKARLSPVLKNLQHIRKLGWWLEVTTLLIPGLNDDDRELADLARFIHDELGPDTVWHLSRFHPDHQLTDRGPTDPVALEHARGIGKAAGLRFVYLGNVPGHKANATFCPACGALVLDRHGFSVAHRPASACPQCHEPIPGVDMDFPSHSRSKA